MVSRTEYTRITNEATANRALQEGVDLVVISSHGATDSCGPHEGKIYSLTGKTKGYEQMDVAIAGSHLFGPNCMHTYTPISDRDANALVEQDPSIKRAGIDLTKFTQAKGPHKPGIGGLVQQQRNLVKLFPTLPIENQKAILELSRLGNSPTLPNLEEIMRQQTNIA